jgi:diguanylate cyclase (GGDEF)-like protein/PAS domain S-box-containing protein
MTPPGPHQPDIEPKECRVLIVDDDPVLRRLCATALRRAGHVPQEAASGEVALECFAHTPTDLVILDVQMDGMDGYEACRRLRQLPGGGNVPVIMLTGLDDAGSIERAYEAGATDFIAKPFQWPLLTQRVRYALRTAATAQANRQVAASLVRAQELAQLGGWSLDLNGSLQCSGELLRILGLPQRDARPVSFSDYLSMTAEADRPRMRRVREALTRDGEGYEAVFVAQRVDGKLRTLYEQALMLRDARGNPLRMEGITQDITDRVEAERRIQQLASHDGLTALPNREFLQKLVAAGLEHARRNRLHCAVLQLDIDRFRTVNDALGVAAGDLVLKVAAKRLCVALGIEEGGVCARGSAVARVGANAFAVFLARATISDEVAAIGQRLLDTIAAPIAVAGRDILLTARMGIALFPRDADDSHALLRFAEQALHVAKRDDNAPMLFYQASITADASSRLVAESELRRALASGEMRMYLQPKLHSTSRQVVGAEALIRWEHPVRGVVQPAEFIPLAEKTGLIGQITDWMLEQACRQYIAWCESGLQAVPLSVNVSPSWFTSRGLMDRVDTLLRQYRMPPGSLVLEVTESLLVRDVDTCIARMRELKRRGVFISLDDFGTGYSSLSYLKTMPLDELKLDRSFVTEIGTARRDRALVASVVQLARTLDIAVVAEGVETEAQAQVLNAMGCRVHQGFLYGRPTPAASFAGLLANARHALTGCSA